MRNRMVSAPILLGVLMFSLTLVGCATVPETGRSQLRLINADQEMKLGLGEFNKLKQATPISSNVAQRAMLERVGKRIAAVAPLPDARWEFILFDQPDQANAFWKRFSAFQAQRGGSGSLEFLSTHPLDETRIRALEARMEQAVREYDKRR